MKRPVATRRPGVPAPGDPCPECQKALRLAGNEEHQVNAQSPEVALLVCDGCRWHVFVPKQTPAPGEITTA